jgi:hypothetical protein
MRFIEYFFRNYFMQRVSLKVAHFNSMRSLSGHAILMSHLCKMGLMTFIGSMGRPQVLHLKRHEVAGASSARFSAARQRQQSSGQVLAEENLRPVSS